MKKLTLKQGEKLANKLIDKWSKEKAKQKSKRPMGLRLVESYNEKIFLPDYDYGF